jgi:hypothetical protein
MIHFCPHCVTTVTNVSPTGLHDADQGGCGNPVTAVATPVEATPSWWDRHGLRILITAVGVMLGVVIVYNAGVIK